MYQDHWVARFLLFEPICGRDGKMKMVRWKVCSKIEGKKKLLMPKLHSMIKHE